MKKFNLFLAIIAISLVACKKETSEPSTPGTNPAEVTKFSEIKTQESFNWSTTKEVNVQVSGLKTMVPVNNTLQLTDVSGKIIYYSGLHSMEENVQVKIILPASATDVQLHYGSVLKTYSLSGNTLAADYIVNYPDEQ